MRWTKSLITTLRDNPGDAEIDSHKLLVRAGLVRKTAGGLYSYLPLGMRTLEKIKRIVKEEMDRAGALEIVMPILQPAELWRTTGRWDTMGANMFKLRDRAEREAALGPTAEEEVFLRPRRRRRGPQLPHDVRRVRAHLRALRAEGRPRAGRRRRHGRQHDA